ncbi:hypothetical protein [Pseudoalteromonas luteoviolacea]|uniref:Uncharacterized protein n=1 Tax=Pseudoalteromonas luteoviolacea S4060-1 TaxID=1365257 RepID=A0A162B6X7_9GAMM|nr:hypothetical protein [Pseudoalteromonas luteoviolacea]KZN67469.1 hypothetical protein N478_01595 [Pseudoalteromonas luteoviolacea S4060-1]
MIRNLLIASAISVTLSGCGGSSNNTQEQTQPAPPKTSTPTPAPTKPSINTAPEITGETSSEILAVTGGEIVFALSDSEGDSLDVSVEHNLEWMSYTQNDNILTLKLQPGLFDIGDYDIRITLSDGKDSTEHSIAISVKDNPDEWGAYPLSKEMLFGGWSNKDESLILAFNKVNQGLVINEGQIEQISLEQNEHGEVQTYLLSCYATPTDCVNKSALDFQVIAKEENKIRIQYKPLGQNATVTTLAKQIAPAMTDKFKYNRPAGELTYMPFPAGYVSVDGEFESLMSVRLIAPNTVDQTSNQLFIIKAEFDKGLFTKSSLNTADSKKASFNHKDSGEKIYYDYYNQYNKIDVLYSSENYTVFDINFENVLTAQTESWLSEEEKEQIRPLLAPRHSLTAIQPLTKATDYIPKKNTTYLTQIFLENQSETPSSSRSHISQEITLLDDSEADLVIAPNTLSHATYTIEDAEMSIELDSQTTKVQLLNSPQSEHIYALTTYSRTYNYYIFETSKRPLLSIFSEQNYQALEQDYLNSTYIMENYKVEFTDKIAVRTHSSGNTQVGEVTYLENGSMDIRWCNGEPLNQACESFTSITMNFKVENKFKDNYLIRTKTKYSGNIERPYSHLMFATKQ